jgi:hypothetical protein
MFEEALRLDGENVDALFGLSETHMWEVNSYVSNNPAAQIQVAEVAISRAQMLMPNDPRIRLVEPLYCLASICPNMRFGK